MSDLISRQDAIEMLEEQLDYLQMLNPTNNPTAESNWYGVNWARNRIADMPSAEPERKTGKWINCKYPLGECSKCHAIVDIQNNEANYCPVCGSKNRGEDNV